MYASTKVRKGIYGNQHNHKSGETFGGLVTMQVVTADAKNRRGSAQSLYLNEDFKNMKKLILYWSIILWFNNAYAVTNSNQSTVAQITIGSAYARIKLANMTSIEGCSNQGYYYLDLSDGKNSGVLSVALTAKATQTPIIVQAGGCYANYPLITHIYLN